MFIFVITVLSFISILSLTVFFFYTEKLEERIWEQRGYYLTLEQEPLMVELHIKDEWLTNLVNYERTEHSITNIEGNEVKVYLEKKVSAITVYVFIERELNREKGLLISSWRKEENGNITWIFPMKNSLTVVNKNGEELLLINNIGQGGMDGELFDLVFTVDFEEESKIEGFSFILDNYQVYQYHKK